MLASRSKSGFRLTLWTVLLLTLIGGSLAPLAQPAADPFAKWEPEIRAFEQADKTNPPPAGVILFVGSSSIRFWSTLAQDFPGKPVLNRGFGGSQMSDCVHFIPRIVTPYRPRQIFLYEGDNDLASGKAPAQVFADYQSFVRDTRAALPDVPILFLSIKPSPSRWKFVEQAKEANRMIESFAKTQRNLSFIDMFTPLLGTDGQPLPDIYRADKLHLNAKGYAIWRGIVAPYLDAR